MNASIGKLVNEFTKLPGVGKRTAFRFAYKILDMDEIDVKNFAKVLVETKKAIKFCKICGNFTDSDEICDLCRCRDDKVICVVKDPKEVETIEEMGDFSFRYHVLHGTISPLKGISPQDIRVKELLARVDGCEEVILALSSDVEGDATGMYIAKLLKPLGVKVSRIARGISIGQDIEYADQVTLKRAFEDRKEM